MYVGGMCLECIVVEGLGRGTERYLKLPSFLIILADSWIYKTMDSISNMRGNELNFDLIMTCLELLNDGVNYYGLMNSFYWLLLIGNCHK